MGRRLTLDTSTVSPAVIRPDDDICLSEVTIAEYITDLMLAAPPHRPRMQRFLDHVLETLPVLPYGEEIVDAHVTLLAWTFQHGRPHG